MEEKLEKVAEVAQKSKGNTKQVLMIGGALIGLALGGLWLSKKKASSDIDDDDEYLDTEDFGPEESSEE